MIMFNFFSIGNAKYDQLATNFKFKGIDGDTINIGEYKNKVIVVVNVASRCGFTYQYEDLQKLWNNYKKQGLVVIGVPTDNFAIMCLLLLIGIIGFAQGFIMLRMEK